MGQETENPIEFLNAAEEAVSAYSELKKSLEEERDRGKERRTGAGKREEARSGEDRKDHQNAAG